MQKGKQQIYNGCKWRGFQPNTLASQESVTQRIPTQENRLCNWCRGTCLKTLEQNTITYSFRFICEFMCIYFVICIKCHRSILHLSRYPVIGRAYHDDPVVAPDYLLSHYCTLTTVLRGTHLLLEHTNHWAITSPHLNKHSLPLNVTLSPYIFSSNICNVKYCPWWGRPILDIDRIIRSAIKCFQMIYLVSSLITSDP